MSDSFGNQQVSFGFSPSVDMFRRLRVSNPETIFDSKQIFDDPDLAASVENQPLFFDNQETSGSGTATAYDNDTASTALSVSDATAGARTRQTRMRFNYQPAKSQLVFRTFKMSAQESGITQRIGLFDDNNGVFFENNGLENRFVIRSYTSGAAVDTAYSQKNWSGDRLDGTDESRITLDPTKTLIMWAAFEWLGVGSVAFGFVINEEYIICHVARHSNIESNVYMSTPNLPLRTQIINSGAGGASSITDICSSVISEGGSQDNGMVRYASTAGAHVDLAAENTLYAVVGIRLKTAYLGLTVKILKAELQLQTASHRCEWVLMLNPTVAGTFTYSDVSRSGVQRALGATANTVTGGYEIDGGFVESGGPGRECGQRWRWDK